jgi:hypothetical protein
MALLVLLCCCGRTALAAGLPDGVVISPKHGLILTEKTFDGLPPWKWAVLSSDDRRQPGTRNDRVVYSSRNGDPNTDFMLFTPVCVSFKDFVQLSLSVRWIVEGTWQTPRGAVMPANGCSDPTIYLTRDQYVNLGGPSAFNAERTWYGYLIYPAVQAFVYVRTYPANPPGKWNLQKIAFHQSGENAVRDYDAEFHFDLAKFIETIGHMAPGVSPMEAASKYGFYSTEFFAAAGVDTSLILFPIGRAGRAGKLVYGTLMAGTVGVSTYNFLKAETDQEKLQAVLDIVMCLSFAHNVIKQAKPKVGLRPPDNLPESVLFEDLIGSASTKQPVLVGCRVLGPASQGASVAGEFSTPYLYMTKGIPAELKGWVEGTVRYKRLIALMEQHPDVFHWKDDFSSKLVSGAIGLDGHVYVRSTVPWARAYVNLWHEVAHTEIYQIPFITNKGKFAVRYGMPLKDFTEAHKNILLDEETFVWADCSLLVDELEAHWEASFITPGGGNLAAGEHAVRDELKKGAGATRTWQGLRETIWHDVGYETDIPDILEQIYKDNGGMADIDILDGKSWRQRLGAPPF